ncbi:MAG: helix-turn-helix domain-containing protein [Thermonemataceae bacterium]|mgnify:CR=1 FL=1
MAVTLAWLILLAPLLPLFILCIIGKKKNTSQADFILLIWLASVFLVTLLNTCEVFRYYRIIPWAIGIAPVLIMVDLGMLFLYGRALLSKPTDLRKPVAMLLACIFFSLVLFSLKVYLQPATVKQSYMEAIYAGRPPLWWSMYESGSIFIVIGTIGYFLYHITKIESKSKNIQPTQLRYFRNFLYMVLVIQLITLFARTLPTHLSQEDAIGLYLFFFSLQLIAICLAGYYGYRQRAIYKENLSHPAPLEEKYMQIFKRLSTQMYEQKLFLDDRLSISQVAILLDENPRYISTSLRLNQVDNFSSYVNRFRVKEVKRLLSHPAYSHWSLLAIAYEAGFSSKTTFNRAFKAIEGMTPSAYKSQKNCKKTAL